MKQRKINPNLKRNALILAVLVFVGGAAYLNWSYNQRWGGAETSLADKEDEMTSAVNAILGRDDSQDYTAATAISGYFAQARLTRQQSRDQALSLLETAASAQTANAETIDAAMKEITAMANYSLMESRIENELLAKQFTDCVVYLSDGNCTVAVPSPEEGLAEADVALITDAVMANTDYSPSQINVIEVINY